MAASRFRDHDNPTPDGLTIALYRDLAVEWAGIQGLASSRTRLRQWTRRYPCLTGCQRPGDIVDLIDRSSPDITDEILHALLELFQAGQQLAGRILLQAMLPKLARMGAAHHRRASTSSLTVEDAHGEVVAEFWSVLSELPLRRTHALAANLALELQRRLTQPRTVHAIPSDPHQVLADHDRHADPADQITPHLGGIGPDDDLQRVLTWALDRHIITPEAASLLADIYLADNQHDAIIARAAADGVNHAMIRKRCKVAKDKIVAAVIAESLGDDHTQSVTA